MLSPAERFLSKTEYQASGCLLFRGSSDKDGYGVFWLGGRNVRAHRASYQLFVGQIPDGTLILHGCDTPACVNPEHLRPGTQKENIADALKRKRRDAVRPPLLCGELNNHAKLSAAQVMEIREAPAFYGYKKALMARFGVTGGTIKHIRAGKTWKHVAGVR